MKDHHVQIDDFTKWLENAKADDFRPQPEDAMHGAWNHFWDGAQILFREGFSAAGIVQMLGDVLEGMEVDDEVEIWED